MQPTRQEVQEAAVIVFGPADDYSMAQFNNAQQVLKEARSMGYAFNKHGDIVREPQQA